MRIKKKEIEDVRFFPMSVVNRNKPIYCNELSELFTENITNTSKIQCPNFGWILWKTQTFPEGARYTKIKLISVRQWSLILVYIYSKYEQLQFFCHLWTFTMCSIWYISFLKLSHNNIYIWRNVPWIQLSLEITTTLLQRALYKIKHTSPKI